MRLFCRGSLNLAEVLSNVQHEHTTQQQHSLALMNRNNKYKKETKLNPKPPKETNPCKHPLFRCIVSSAYRRRGSALSLRRRECDEAGRVR